MMDECRKGGLPEPTIDEYADGIRVSFQKGEEKGTNEGKGKSKSKEKSKEKSKGKSSKEKILEEMTKNSLITIRELAHFLDLSIAGVEKNIRALKTEGLLRRVGPDKGGHWDVLKNEE